MVHCYSRWHISLSCRTSSLYRFFQLLFLFYIEIPPDGVVSLCKTTTSLFSWLNINPYYFAISDHVFIWIWTCWLLSPHKTMSLVNSIRSNSIRFELFYFQVFLETLFWISFMTLMNKRSESTPPCLSPVVMVKISVVPTRILTLFEMFWCRSLMSKNTIQRSWFNSYLFSINCLRPNIRSIVDLPRLHLIAVAFRIKGLP